MFFGVRFLNLDPKWELTGYAPWKLLGLPQKVVIELRGHKSEACLRMDD